LAVVVVQNFLTSAQTTDCQAVQAVAVVGLILETPQALVALVLLDKVLRVALVFP
jgi:hypothetical protein